MESWTFLLGMAAVSFGAGLLTSTVWRRARNWRRCWLIFVMCAMPALGLASVVDWHPLADLSDVYAVVSVVAALLLGMQLGDQILVGRGNSVAREGDG